MRIGIFTNYHLEQFGGAEEALDRLATLWTKAGNDVVLFSSPADARCKVRPWNPTYKHVRIPAPFSTRFGLSRYVRFLAREHAVRPFDVVMASDAYWAGHVVREFSLRENTPYVVYSHGSDCMEGSRFLRKPVCLKRMRAVVRDADGIACISSYMQQRLCSISEPAGIVRRIVNGWPDAWADEEVSGRVVTGSYLFAIGRVDRRKGFQVLVDSFSQLRPRHPYLGLIIAGDGPYFGELFAQAERLGLSPGRELPRQREPIGVCFPGFVQGETKRSLVRHASVGVCPSVWQEPQGIVLLEMLSQGVPVVASNVGGIPDVVEPDVNGQLFAMGDSSDLTAKLDKLLSFPDQRSKLASQAAASVAQYRWSEVARNHLQLLRDAVAARRTRNETRRSA
jgi:glycosyltransferase involved in cell wall biosynthesis